MRSKRVLVLVLAVLLSIAGIILFRDSGSFLVADNRAKSDAIVITQGDSLDAAYWMGLSLLHEGYGRDLLVDARNNKVYFGRTQSEAAADFIQKTAADVPGQVRVCSIAADTTAKEAYEVGACLKGHGIHSVLLVVDSFHCRRSLLMFSHLLPQYRWSIAPVPVPGDFGTRWWRKREWIRTAVVEYQHLIWWELIDRWRFPARA